MDNINEIFETIVKIDSVSGEEENLRNFIIDLIKKKNYFYKVDKAGNLFIKIKGKNNPLLFVSHLDTVEPGRGIKPIIKNDYYFSDGRTILGADNKVFVAVLLDLLLNQKIERNLEIIFSVKEETGSGIEFFPFSWLESKNGIIFDNANPIGGIVLRSPEIINFYLEFIGKASHSSKINEGINSLIPAIEFLKKIPVGFYKRETTINIGILNSGSAINTIPEKTILKGEIRSYKSKDFNYFKNKILSYTDLIQKKFKGKIIINLDGYCPGYIHLKDDKFIKVIKKIMMDNKLKTYFIKKSGVSDANILNSKEIKTVVLADGVIDSHTKRERFKISNFDVLKKLILDFIRKI